MLDTRLAQKVGIAETQFTQSMGQLHVQKAETERQLEHINSEIKKHIGAIEALRMTKQYIKEIWDAQKKEQTEEQARKTVAGMGLTATETRKAAGQCETL